MSIWGWGDDGPSHSTGKNKHAYGGKGAARNTQPRQSSGGGGKKGGGGGKKGGGGGKKKDGCPLWVLAWGMALTVLGKAVAESL